MGSPDRPVTTRAGARPAPGRPAGQRSCQVAGTMRGMRPRSSCWVLGLLAVLACGRPESPQDAAFRTQSAPELNPSLVRELEIEHTGCFGPCPVYRVRINDSGQVEYEGKQFVRQVGRAGYSLHPSDVSPLFTWLRDHAKLYAASADHRHGVDAEEVTFRFHLKSGQTAVIEWMAGFVGDDLWALSNIADGIAFRALINDRENSREPKPAT